MKKIILTLTTATSLLFSTSSWGAPLFTAFNGLGSLPGGSSFSKANAVSADGSIIVGISSSKNGGEAFRYQNGVMTGLGDLPGGDFSSEARGISADGSTIVGSSYSNNALSEAFSYQNGVMSALGNLPGVAGSSFAHGVSTDGSIIVGNNFSTQEALLYKNGTVTGLGILPGGVSSQSAALDVSADGSLVVGFSSSINGITEAFIYQNGVMSGLGDLVGGIFSSQANGISADGSTIVGVSYGLGVGTGGPTDGFEAFIYQNGIMRGLGDLPGGLFTSVATDISADGSIISGYGESANGQEAVFWDVGSMSIHSVADRLLLDGFDIATDGWSDLQVASAISEDGSTLIGYGTHNGQKEAWVAKITNVSTVPVPSAIWLLASALAALLCTKRKYQP